MERIISLLAEQNSLLREQTKMLNDIQKELKRESESKNKKTYRNYQTRYGATVNTPDKHYV